MRWRRNLPCPYYMIEYASEKCRHFHRCTGYNPFGSEISFSREYSSSLSPVKYYCKKCPGQIRKKKSQNRNHNVKAQSFFSCLYLLLSDITKHCVLKVAVMKNYLKLYPQKFISDIFIERRQIICKFAITHPNSKIMTTRTNEKP